MRNRGCTGLRGMVLLVALCGATMARAEGDLEPISLGRFLIYPSLGISLKWDDNIFRANDQDPTVAGFSSEVTSYHPTIRFEVPFRKSEIAMGYQPYYQDYTSLELSAVDRWSHVAWLEGHFQIAPALRLDLQDRYVNAASELREVDPGGEFRFGIQPFVTNGAQATLVFEGSGVHSFEVEGHVDRTTLDQTAGENLAVRLGREGVMARYLLATSPANQIFAALGLEKVDQARGTLQLDPTDYENRSAGVGFRRQMPGSLMSEIQLAYTDSRFDEAFVAPFQGLTVDGSLAAQLGATTAVKLELFRGPLQSFFNTNAYYLNEQANLQCEKQLGPQMYVKVEGTYRNNNYPERVRVKVDGSPEEQSLDGNGDGIIDTYAFLAPSEGVKRRDRSSVGAVALGYKLLRGMRLEVAYRREARASNIVAQGRRCSDSGSSLANCEPPAVPVDYDYDIFDYDARQVVVKLVFGWQ